HFPGVIERFGPPASFAAWAQERLNGLLGKAKTNNHPAACRNTEQDAVPAMDPASDIEASEWYN
ncbi:hypothetical protein PSTG_18396, partial [Puccinia striiformis f. sp. tritici PST-78]